ncbi:unnamed protein product [Rhizophagus irregularis]|uniref:Uncharacterized protein n=1 Tax=Rhizophagus irregularis TaxID=588596 RepID=A0A915Z6V0_9GLOM|nr:unnamed protein product [Rhizophagus irregularis]CAB5187993.1 unnamed protein product [Rhizophagus irregularis]CAB5364118.1 unnamed protein product [Rhizophagus irregularis]
MNSRNSEKLNSNLSNETNKQKYLLPDRFLRQDLVGNEITQNNTKQYSNSTFKNVIWYGLYLRIKIYSRPILRFHLLYL